MNDPVRTVPEYDDLPVSPYGGRHAWNVPGVAERGTVAFISPEITIRATRSVRTGEVISLNAALDVIDPPLFGRQSLQHRVDVKREDLVLDDRVDALYPQVSSQWDALNHIGAFPGVFFGGVSLQEQQERRLNGIDVWARTGIVGRGVLLDVASILRERLEDYCPGESVPVTIADLEQAIDQQGISLEFGDILVLNMGYLSWYRGLEHSARAALSEAGGEVRAAGLEHSEEVARFLWNAGIAAIAADSLGVEMWPPDRSPATRPFGFLHSSLIGHLGMAIGELWELSTLVQRCTSQGRWDFLLCSAPLNLAGGVGSPANAVAIL